MGLMPAESRADAGVVAIQAAFGIGAGAAAGPGAADCDIEALAGLPRRRGPRQPIFPFSFPPGLLAGTTVGSFLDLPDQFGPAAGWFWDVTSLSLSGFTAGAVAVTRNAPLITPSGAANAVEPVASFTQAGIIPFGQKGNPLLDGNDRLVFCVTAAITGYVQISGTVIMVPASRIDEYLSL